MTLRNVTTCVNEKVVNHTYVVCPGGKTSGESGNDTLCNAIAALFGLVIGLLAAQVTTANIVILALMTGYPGEAERDTLCEATSRANEKVPGGKNLRRANEVYQREGGEMQVI